MKKNALIAVLLLILLGLATVAVLRLRSPEDAWVCRNGLWVAHGHPDTPKPFGPCGPPSVTPPTEPPPSAPPTATSSATADTPIEIISPRAGETIVGRFAVSGRARGSWYFEGVFPAELRLSDGRVLARATARAQGEWMSDDFVPFVAMFDYAAVSEQDAVVALKRDNPSGLSENEAEIVVPVRIRPLRDGEMAAFVYFGSAVADPGASVCDRTYPAHRTMPLTAAPARAALSALLAGPTEREVADGFTTAINPGVAVKSLAIENGVARVDFDARLGERVGGSCRVAAIRSQIENTLRQFDSVRAVIISVEGNVEEALQP